MVKKIFSVLKITVLLAGLIPGIAATSLAAIPDRYNITMVYSGLDSAVIPDSLKAEGKADQATVCVAEFVDARQVADKKNVGHVREIGDKRVPVYLKNGLPAKIIANSVKEYLKKAGYNVSDETVQWDLKEDTLPKKGPKLLIGGSLDEMEVSCWTGVFSNDYKAGMKISLVLADAAKGNILYRGQVTVSLSKTDLSYTEAQLGHQADLALAQAVEKLFEGKTVAQIIREMAAQ